MTETQPSSPNIKISPTSELAHTIKPNTSYSRGLRTNPSQASLKTPSDHSPPTDLNGLRNDASSSPNSPNQYNRSVSTSSSSALSNFFVLNSNGISQPTTPLSGKPLISEEKLTSTIITTNDNSSYVDLKLDVDLLSKKIDDLLESDI